MMDELDEYQLELQKHLDQIEYYLLCTNDDVIRFFEMVLEGLVDRHFGGLTKWDDKFVCINCKAEFGELPVKQNNECSGGYYHDFVKRSDIIKGEDRRR
jgi:hypothetical protein